MDRQDIIEKAYSRKEELEVSNKEYRENALRIFSGLASGDIGKGDITTETLFTKDKDTKAGIIAKQDGIIAGCDETLMFLENAGIKADRLITDGNSVRKSEEIMAIRGSAKLFLSYERTILNIMQRMSGVATITEKILSMAKKSKNNSRIAGTRKTLLGALDHKAISVGGGFSHRLNLEEAILIKKNHIEYSGKSIKDLLEAAWNERKNARFIEIEASNKNSAIKSAEAFKVLQKNYDEYLFPCIIMLDNFSPEEIKKTIAEIEKKNLYDNAVIEVSGGIDEKNIKKFCIEGVDVISMGSLTHSARTLDLGIK